MHSPNSPTIINSFQSCFICTLTKFFNLTRPLSDFWSSSQYPVIFIYKYQWYLFFKDWLWNWGQFGYNWNPINPQSWFCLFIWLGQCVHLLSPLSVETCVLWAIFFFSYSPTLETPNKLSEIRPRPSMVAQGSNPRTQEEDAERSLRIRPAWSTWSDSGQ